MLKELIRERAWLDLDARGMDAEAERCQPRESNHEGISWGDVGRMEKKMETTRFEQVICWGS